MGYTKTGVPIACTMHMALSTEGLKFIGITGQLFVIKLVCVCIQLADIHDPCVCPDFFRQYQFMCTLPVYLNINKA